MCESRTLGLLLLAAIIKASREPFSAPASSWMFAGSAGVQGCVHWWLLGCEQVLTHLGFYIMLLSV